jgi:hypothetical protein
MHQLQHFIETFGLSRLRRDGRFHPVHSCWKQEQASGLPDGSPGFETGREILNNVQIPNIAPISVGDICLLPMISVSGLKYQVAVQIENNKSVPESLHGEPSFKSQFLFTVCRKSGFVSMLPFPSNPP